MKKTLTAFLPALALLTLGSCASTSQLSSTEDDGVYYSSKDRTTQNATASVVAPAGRSGSQNSQGNDTSSDTDEATNPEYRGGSAGSTTGTGSSSEYYDDDYGYAARIRRFNQPTYRGFSYGYYDFVYTDPFWYGGGFSPYAWGSSYYPSFYDPFYSPYGYGGAYVSINIGFGHPYYNPWYGYGRGYGYGGRGYGYGGGYGGYGYGGGYYNGYRNGYYDGVNRGGSGYGAKRYYGPRRDGGRQAVSSTAGSAASSRGRISNGGAATVGGVTNSGGVTRVTNASSAPAVESGRGRGRMLETSTGGIKAQDTPVRQPMNDQYTSGSDRMERQLKERESRRGQILDASERVNNPALGTEGEPEQPRLNTDNARGRWRVVENGTGTDASPATPRDYAQPRRGRYRETQPSQSSGSVEQPQRPVRQRVSEEVVRQPRQQSEQPVRQQTYSEPARISSPPSNSGGNNSGSGNSSRGRGRME